MTYYHMIDIRVNETCWTHVWRLYFHYLRTGYDIGEGWVGVSSSGGDDGGSKYQNGMA
jgi:hypothetical protein